VGLERGPLSLVSTTEELLSIKSSDSGLENREYGSNILYPQTLALTSPTSGGSSVGIVRSQTKRHGVFVSVGYTTQCLVTTADELERI
jgi:hypothetical protein